MGEYTRTIKECIAESVDVIEDINARSIALEGFLQTMSAILILDAHYRLSADRPIAKIGETKIGGGKAIEFPDVEDYISVITGGDMIRHTEQYSQLNEFLNWFLDQDEPIFDPDDEDVDIEETLWYSRAFIGKKWNEYAEKRNKEAQR